MSGASAEVHIRGPRLGRPDRHDPPRLHASRFPRTGLEAPRAIGQLIRSRSQTPRTTCPMTSTTSSLAKAGPATWGQTTRRLKLKTHSWTRHWYHTLRTYDMAVAAVPTYTNFHGGTVTGACRDRDDGQSRQPGDFTNATSACASNSSRTTRISSTRQRTQDRIRTAR